MDGIDLQGGIIPISKAASSLAALLRRAKTTGKPVVVTQKGYPTGVILDVESYVALRELAQAGEEARRGQIVTAANAGYAALRDNPEAWAEIQAERGLLNG